MGYYVINWTPQLQKKALDHLTTYLMTHGIGECIMQSDDAIIEAPEMLADIADLEGLIQYVNED